MKLYKVVRTQEGLAVATVVPQGTVVEPEGRDSVVRAASLLVEYISNNQPMGWGPVDGRTVYRVGEVTEADALEKDADASSGPGLYACTSEKAARDWMESAEI